jgi:hypothetical protein
MRRLLLPALLSLLATSACGPGTDPSDDSTGDDTASTDADGDGWTQQGGDCDDNNPLVFPGAPEQADGIDNDCNGQVDDHLPTSDDDGDGYSGVEGDCDDSEPLINPGAVEVNETVDDQGNIIPEGVDNDCDGQIDEGTQPCDAAIGGPDPRDFAHAAELCDFLVDATWDDNIPNVQHAVRGAFGQYTPHAGHALGVISTGAAVDESDPTWTNPSPGATVNGAQVAHPDPHPANGCSADDPPMVQDHVGLTLHIRVPTNAQAIMFDFAFMSAEFPEWVCTSYDDTFLAMLDSENFHGNVSFDDAGNPVTINVGFFDVCAPGQGPDCTGNSELSGTGFESYGGTGWLHTIAPVTPGETITLHFHLFDEGDNIWDSLTLIDNFQWLGVPVDGPVTIPLQHSEDAVHDLMRGMSAEEVAAEY